MVWKLSPYSWAQKHMRLDKILKDGLLQYNIIGYFCIFMASSDPNFQFYNVSSLLLSESLLTFRKLTNFKVIHKN